MKDQGASVSKDTIKRYLHPESKTISTFSTDEYREEPKIKHGVVGLRASHLICKRLDG